MLSYDHGRNSPKTNGQGIILDLLWSPSCVSSCSSSCCILRLLIINAIYNYYWNTKQHTPVDKHTTSRFTKTTKRRMCNQARGRSWTMELQYTNAIHQASSTRQFIKRQAQGNSWTFWLPQRFIVKSTVWIQAATSDRPATCSEDVI